MRKAAFLVGALLLVLTTSVLGEVRVKSNGGTEVVITPFTGEGGVDPWPHVSSGVPDEWVLNPYGSSGTHKDGWPSYALDVTHDRIEVAWARHDGGDYEIVTSYWDGTSWSTPAAATWTSSDCKNPSLSFLSDGTAHLRFTESGSAYYVERPVGGTWGTPQLVGGGI